MRLRYEPSFAHQGAWEVDEIRDRFVDQLQRTRGEEVRRGTTRIGPQRDDVSFLANDLELRLYGSRGQNRTAMLAYKLAEIEWLNQQRGEMPVLLLDEVLAELDPERRKDLQQRLLEAPQALLTAADLSMFDDGFRRRATLWRVASGSITKLANGQIKPNSAQNV
jgi:DNA replication and repair protein RecF